MKLVNTLIVWLVVLNSWQSHAQDTDRIIQKGNESYKRKEYPMAEAAYDEVLGQDPNNSTAKYNKAAALYRQTKPDESVKVLEDLAFKAGVFLGHCGNAGDITRRDLGGRAASAGSSRRPRQPLNSFFENKLIYAIIIHFNIK